MRTHFKVQRRLDQTIHTQMRNPAEYMEWDDTVLGEFLSYDLAKKSAERVAKERWLDYRHKLELSFIHLYEYRIVQVTEEPFDSEIIRSPEDAK